MVWGGFNRSRLAGDLKVFLNELIFAYKRHLTVVIGKNVHGKFD